MKTLFLRAYDDDHTGGGISSGAFMIPLNELPVDELAAEVGRLKPASEGELVKLTRIGMTYAFSEGKWLDGIDCDVLDEELFPEDDFAIVDELPDLDGSHEIKTNSGYLTLSADGLLDFEAYTDEIRVYTVGMIEVQALQEALRDEVPANP